MKIHIKLKLIKTSMTRDWSPFKYFWTRKKKKLKKLKKLFTKVQKTDFGPNLTPFFAQKTEKSENRSPSLFSTYGPLTSCKK